MADLNSVNLVGRSKDAAKTFPVGTSKKSSILVETVRQAYDTKAGTQREFRESFEAVGWGRTAERMEFIQAGQQVAVKGHLQNVSFDRGGEKVWKTVVNVEDIQIDGTVQTPAQSQQTDEPF